MPRSLGEQRLAFDGLTTSPSCIHVGIGSNHLEIEDPGAGATRVGRFEQAAATLGLSVCLADVSAAGKRCRLPGTRFFD